MASVPNIPSVVVTIEDFSYVQPVLSSGRTVLIPFFSKYGNEEFTYWSTWEEFQEKFGPVDPNKYGMAQIYIKGASQFTQSFLGKRLMPSDATFANKIKLFSNDGVIEESLSGVTSQSAFPAEIGDEGLAFYATGKGSGYNDIVVLFEPLEDYTKFYNDENGIPNYQFNFLSATIYEKQDNGTLRKIERNSIPVALVDIDPKNGATIKDIYDRKSLNIEDRFESISQFIRTFLKDDNNELSEYMGPKDLGSVLFWDPTFSKPAYIVFEDGNITLEYIDADPEEAKPYARFHYKDGDDDKYAIVKIDNGKIIITDDTDNGAQDGDLEYMLIASSKAFYKLTISKNGNFIAKDVKKEQFTSGRGQMTFKASFDCTGAAVIVDDVIAEEGTEYTVDGNTITFKKPLAYGQNVVIISQSQDDDPEIKLELFKFARYNLWRNLIENGVQLSNGFDGQYLYINGQLNFDGPGETGKENAKMLLVDFYSSNPDLREVLYPKYDFDYVPDFTSDPDVQAAITNLCDYIQTAFGIHTCGIHYDYTQDIDYRKYYLGISSFCNALYSGQANRKHYDSDLGRTIVMPSNYYALLDHLYVDGAMDIAEPVAGIDKGSLRTGAIKLTYTPSSLEIEKLRMKQINAIIDEPEGIYFIDQLTMYKRSSILSRIHAVKPIMKVKKDLRKLLKDVLESKDGKTAIGRVRTIIDTYMKDTVYNALKNRSGFFEYYKFDVTFDEDKLELKVLLTVKPLRSVEKVSVTIGVV